MTIGLTKLVERYLAAASGWPFWPASGIGRFAGDGSDLSEGVGVQRCWSGGVRSDHRF